MSYLDLCCYNNCHCEGFWYFYAHCSCREVYVEVAVWSDTNGDEPSSNSLNSEKSVNGCKIDPERIVFKVKVNKGIKCKKAGMQK